MVDKNIKLVDVIQVMLVHHILPCQGRISPLWEFDPEKHHTLERTIGTTHEDVWKLLFKGNETPPAIDSDRGRDLAHPASAVSPSHRGASSTCLFKEDVQNFTFYFFRYGQRKRSGFNVRLRCPRNQPSRS